MSEEKYILDPDPEEIGVQNDGEPAVVESAEPKGQEEGNEPEPEQETPEQEAEHKRKTGSQRAKERAQRLEAKVEMLERMLLEREQPKPADAPKPVSSERPKLEAFNTFDEYNEALTDWKVKRVLEEREAKNQEVEVRRTFDQKAEAAREKYEDFDEAISALPQLPAHIGSVVAASEYTADIAYHLANNPKDLRRILALPAGQAALEVARLEVRFAQPKKEELKKTQTPKPLSPVSAPSAPAPKDDGRLVVY